MDNKVLALEKKFRTDWGRRCGRWSVERQVAQGRASLSPMVLRCYVNGRLWGFSMLRASTSGAVNMEKNWQHGSVA